jgi:hypothetical protein
MYLTAQHITNRAGELDVHTFLHLHDRDDCRFPSDPLSVPERNPGRLVARSPNPKIPPGGNRVVAYLDLIAEDNFWKRTRLMSSIEAVAELMSGRALPWVAKVGFVHVIFNATDGLPVVSEYRGLLSAAMRLWDTYEHT